MKKKNVLICGKCGHWHPDYVYKEEGYCGLYTNAYTRSHRVCQKAYFDEFPNVYPKKLNEEKKPTAREGK